MQVSPEPQIFFHEKLIGGHLPSVLIDMLIYNDKRITSEVNEISGLQVIL